MQTEQPANAPTLTVIGHIETPWTEAKDCPRNAMETDTVCRIVLAPAFRAGLKSLETCSHVFLLYWLDRADRGTITLTPPNDLETHGVFALRAPGRPNPIGLAVADLVDVTEDGLLVRNVDCFDGTPLIDIKPYFASTDAKPQARVGWHERRARPLPPQGRTGGA